MEALDLAVGLWTVGLGLLGCDAQLGAGVAPQVGLVAAAVVADHALDGDAAISEPGDRVLEDGDRGLFGLVVVGFDVGDAGVVVDDGVQVAGSDQRLPVPALRCPGPGRGSRPVPPADFAADLDRKE